MKDCCFSRMPTAKATLLCCLLAITISCVVGEGAVKRPFGAEMAKDFNCEKIYLANNCEFWVEGIATTYFDRNGFFQRQLYAQVIVADKPKDVPTPTPLIVSSLLVKNLTDNTYFETFSPLATPSWVSASSAITTT